jgi:hypothetical protein
MSIATREILKEKVLTINKAIIPNEMKLVEEMIKGKGQLKKKKKKKKGAHGTQKKKKKNLNLIPLKKMPQFILFFLKVPRH